MAYARYESVAVNTAGDVIPNATIEVREDRAGRPVVPLWANREGTEPLGNPIKSDELGKFGFYVKGGSYYIRVFTGPSQQPFQQYVRRHQAIGTAAERDVEDLATALETGTATFPTLAELEAFVPSAQGVGGKVTTGPDAGFYHRNWETSAWVFDRPLYDSLARMNVTGGTANAIEAETASGVADSAVVMLWIEAPGDNTGPVTINGKEVLTASGNSLIAGQWDEGRTYWFSDEGTNYKLRTESDVDGIATQVEIWANETLDNKNYAEEWAQSDAPISEEAGGDGVNDKSSKAWAKESENSAAEAAGYAAGLNLPTIVPGDAGKQLVVDDAEEGYELREPPMGGIPSRAWAIANLQPFIAPESLRTDGYSSAGDGGGALYKKVASEPSHAGKLSITLAVSGTVVWYEIAETNVSVKMFGAIGDGVAEDAPAIQNTMNFSKISGADIFVPDGRYKISTTLLFDRSADPSGSPGLVMRGAGMFQSVLINTIAAGGPTIDLTSGASKYQFGGHIQGLGFEHSGSGANSHGIRYRSCWHQVFRALSFQSLNGAGLKCINTNNDADASAQVMIDDIYAVGLQGAAWDGSGGTGGVTLHTLRQVNAVSCAKTVGNAYIIIDGAIQFSMEMCSLSGGAADNIRPLVSIRSTNVRSRQIEIRGGEFGNNSGIHFEIKAVSSLHVTGIRHVRRAGETNSTTGFEFPDGTGLYSGIYIEGVELQIDHASPAWTWIRHGTGLDSGGQIEIESPNITNFAAGNILHAYTAGAKQRNISVMQDANGAEVLSPPVKRQRVIFNATGSVTPDLTAGQWYQAQFNVSGAFTILPPIGGQIEGRRMILSIFKDGTNTVSWNSAYEAPTVPTNGGTFEFIYDSTSSLWRLIQ